METKTERRFVLRGENGLYLGKGNVLFPLRMAKIIKPFSAARKIGREQGLDVVPVRVTIGAESEGLGYVWRVQDVALWEVAP